MLKFKDEVWFACPGEVADHIAALPPGTGSNPSFHTKRILNLARAVELRLRGVREQCVMMPHVIADLEIGKSILDPWIKGFAMQCQETGPGRRAPQHLSMATEQQQQN